MSSESETKSKERTYVRCSDNLDKLTKYKRLVGWSARIVYFENNYSGWHVQGCRCGHGQKPRLVDEHIARMFHLVYPRDLCDKCFTPKKTEDAKEAKNAKK